MEKKDGINVENITFDANGEVAGLDDATLDEIAAGAGIATDPEMTEDANNCNCVIIKPL